MEEGTCVNYDEEDFNQQFPMGCRYDWGAGLCLSRDIKDRSKGCANYFEGVMNDKIFPQGVVLYGTIARRPRGLFSEERPGVVRHALAETERSNFSEERPGVVRHALAETERSNFSEERPGVVRHALAETERSNFSEERPGVVRHALAETERSNFSEERPGVVRHTPLTGSVPNAQVLESFTIVTACFFCWKRKEDDVLATTYIYDEPWDPVKEGKLQLHPIEDGAAMGGDDD